MQNTPGVFPTIKALVLDQVHQTKGLVAPEELAKLVLKHFPWSAWKPTHWAWYRYQICKGRFRDEFSAKERGNLGEGEPSPKRGPEEARVGDNLPGDAVGVTRNRRGPQPEVKRIGDTILSQVRFALSLAAPQDANLRFRLNRWVYARLMQDEIRGKRVIKQKLWGESPPPRACAVCGEEFEALKDLELHRTDPDLAYAVENCVLLHRRCHQGLP